MGVSRYFNFFFELKEMKFFALFCTLFVVYGEVETSEVYVDDIPEALLGERAKFLKPLNLDETQIDFDDETPIDFDEDLEGLEKNVSSDTNLVEASDETPTDFDEDLEDLEGLEKNISSDTDLHEASDETPIDFDEDLEGLEKNASSDTNLIEASEGYKGEDPVYHKSDKAPINFDDIQQQVAVDMVEENITLSEENITSSPGMLGDGKTIYAKNESDPINFDEVDTEEVKELVDVEGKDETGGGEAQYDDLNDESVEDIDLSFLQEDDPKPAGSDKIVAEYAHGELPPLNLTE